MSKLEELIAELCPDGVEYKTLGEICEITAGGDVPKDHWNKESNEQYSIPIYSNSIENDGLYGYTESPKITRPAVTLSGRGAGCGNVILRKKPYFPIIRLITLVPGNDLLASFLYFYLQTVKFNIPKTGISQLTIPMVSKYVIPIPPLEIQSEIVRILDAFSELKTELKAELKARKKQYAYYRHNLLCFDEHHPLHESITKLCPDGVEYKTLGEIGTMIRGNGLQKKDFTETGVGCIHYGQIYTYYGLFTDKTKSFVSPDLAEKLQMVQKGDIILAVTSENIEDVCKCVAWLGDEEIVTGGHSAIFKHNQNPKYIAYWFQTEEFAIQKRKIAQGTKVIDVTTKKLETIKIPVPPLEIQNEIVSILDNYEKLCTSLTSGLPAEIAAREKQYEYYRDLLLTFKPKVTA